MKQKYSELFKNIVKAYYEDRLEEIVSEILSQDEIDKADLCKVISSLCGIGITYSENFIEDLNQGIKSYEANHKVVNKIKHCSMDCADIHGETLCQKSCPFNAIFIDKEKKTSVINSEKCTDCGFCVEACPSGGILDRVEFIPLLDLIKGDHPVIAAVAPAIIGQFGDNVTIEQLRSAFKKIGFTDMVEVAFFADMLTLKEAVEFDHFVKKKDDLMITSCCCPMWVGMLKRVYEDMVRYVSPSVSPMIAAGRVMKKLNNDCKVVFIGPCIAKKAEAKEKDLIGDIDFVLTFAELKDIFEALNINPIELESDSSTEYASRGGRLYARTGGVSIAVSEAIEKLFPEKHDLIKTVQANGVKECKAILEKAQNGNVDANFIEGMGCIGGCVGGPKAVISRAKGTEHVNTLAENSAIKIAVDSSCMNKILDNLGIHSIEDFKDESKIEIFERKF
ncbi:[Fe-Fe] hydrogenase large subunit C-terminal domain-containing protein [Clostridium magnum]|uniref:Periplasmic [Fe] hydrogenase large subunit n=1 Tax=Clostridium magnum DSM 2767 TaxID=1121326 RepID=A0A162TV47_9CLOT|nr:[Fe-Fe] hydrogenase large subunit C-terminal domain-containing protein [Clostridium magnum]KZL93103.1 periplasmic [Fe] hydrogenase large subunit [Clostridium magnum DSM 2767]SHI74343.1 Iron only hydrogenase large subunit, C-terminal domain [Clostridium magnum DSM 2767]